MIDRNEETAFPVPIGQTGEDRCGISLRDWFAGQALQGTLDPVDAHYGQHNAIALAQAAYGVADAMIEARKEAKQ